MFTFTFDLLTFVQLLVGFILPVLVGLVTTRVTSSGKKAVLLAVLTVVTSVGIGLIDALSAREAFDFGAALMNALPQFVVSVATHYGLWKPTGVSQKAQNSLGGRSK